jgi:hypothetical protein
MLPKMRVGQTGGYNPVGRSGVCGGVGYRRKVGCGVEIRKAGLRKILAPGDMPQGDSAGEDEKRELLWIC